MKMLTLALVMQLAACSAQERTGDEPSFQYVEAKDAGAAMIFDRRSGCLAQVSFSQHHEAVGSAGAAAKPSVGKEQTPKFDPEGEWDAASPITTVTNIGDWKCPAPVAVRIESAKK